MKEVVVQPISLSEYRATHELKGSVGEKVRRAGARARQVPLATAKRLQALKDRQNLEKVRKGLKIVGRTADKMTDTPQKRKAVGTAAGIVISFTPAKEIILESRKARLEAQKTAHQADPRIQMAGEGAKVLTPKKIEKVGIEDSGAAIDAVTNPSLDTTGRVLKGAEAFEPKLSRISEMRVIMEDTVYKVEQQKQTKIQSQPQPAPVQAAA